MKIVYYIQKFLSMVNKMLKSINFIMLLFIFTNLIILPKKFYNVEDYTSIGLRVADFLLEQQNSDGVIPDVPGGTIANEDSNMEYALMGLAAAYRYSHDPRYLEGLTRGITWLAARQEMRDPTWRGSWRYAYAATPPYAPVPVSPGAGIVDVRGVDSTGALFVYLLYLHSVLSGDRTLATRYEARARAALDFILTHNQSPDGFFYSSWQQSAQDGQWRLWKFRYSADQADVYLGMQAGWLLYRDKRYKQAANRLKTQVPVLFFDTQNQRYALGIYEDGALESSLTDFNAIFPQGYIPWALGGHKNNSLAWKWLKHCVQPDGGLTCYRGDPQFSLSVDVYTLAASSLRRPRPFASLDWLIRTTLDPTDGGVRDTRDPTSPKFTNVAGFTVMAFLEFPAVP
jgi:hypothetical protein